MAEKRPYDALIILGGRQQHNNAKYAAENISASLANINALCRINAT